jgi:hypothetical protein
MEKSLNLGLEYEELAHKILYFPKACPDPQGVIEYLESMPEEWYENSSEWNELLGGPARHDCHVAFPSQEEADVVSDVFQTFCAKYGETLKDERAGRYQKEDIEYNAARYRLGGEAKNHVDQPTTEDIGLLNICIYLNDDYEGGELGFVLDEDRKHDNALPDLEKDLMYTPKSGDVLVFPGHFFHYALPTKKGTKYLVLIKTMVQREGIDAEYVGVDEDGVQMNDYMNDDRASS